MSLPQPAAADQNGNHEQRISQLEERADSASDLLQEIVRKVTALVAKVDRLYAKVDRVLELRLLP